MSSRRGLFAALEEAIKRCFYIDEEDALRRAKEIRDIKEMPLVDYAGLEYLD